MSSTLKFTAKPFFIASSAPPSSTHNQVSKPALKTSTTDADAVENLMPMLSKETIRFVWLVRLAHTLIPYKPFRLWIDRLNLYYGGTVSALRHLHTPALRKNVQEVMFTTQDNQTLRGWYLKPKPDQPTLLIANGNNFPLHRLEPLLIRTLEQGKGLFVFDYRGSGKSKGIASETGYYEDMAAASQFLVNKKATPYNQQIVVGLSLGGAVAVHQAQLKPYKAVVLMGTFTNYPAALERLYRVIGLPVKHMQLDKTYSFKFDSLSKVNNIKSPLLIGYAQDDGLIPPEMSRALYDAATQATKKSLFSSPNGNHIYGLFSLVEKLFPKLDKFIQSTPPLQAKQTVSR
jgi:uncharacterized protein